MQRKGRGFPLEYYPGEILTDAQAEKIVKCFCLESRVWVEL